MTNREPPGIRQPPGIPSGGGKGAGRPVIGCLVIVAIVIVGFVACTAIGSSHTSTSSSSSDVSKYTQTWPKSYAETTCADWLQTMTSAQRFAAAADILSSARNKIDGGTGLPPDSLITEFAVGTSNVCVVPTMTITDATYGLYSTEPRFHP